MAVCHIEGADKLTFKGKQAALTSLSDKREYPLYQTRWTKWVNFGGAEYYVKRAGSWLWNVVSGIVLGLTVDLLGGFFFGLFGKDFPSLAEKVKIDSE